MSPSPTAGGDTGATATSGNRRVIPRPPLPGDKDHHPEWDAGTGTSVGQLMLLPFTLAGYGTEDVSLAAVMIQLPLPLSFCSIRIQYSGVPGSVEAEVSSVENTSHMVVDARVENEGNGWAGSGANPWHLDAQTESILFLTNESNKTARIGFSVTANGVHYYLTGLLLQPHETRAINIRQLRDAQFADFKTNKIPAAASDGSVDWVRVDNVPVMGRLLVIERRKGMTSSYDCCTCACPLFYDGNLVTSPGNYNLLPGDSASYYCTAEFYDCNYNYYEYDETSAAEWQSSDTSIATVSGDTADAVGAGLASIQATFKGCSDYKANFCTCDQETSAESSSGVTVQVPQFVKVIYTQCGVRSCPAGYTSTTLEMYIPYQALDVNGNPIPVSGLAVQESFQNISGTCSPTPVPSQATTDATGSFTDSIWLCCAANWSCGKSWNQYFTVNGYPVVILSSGTTGAKNVVQVACNSGQGACLIVYPTP